MIKETKEVKQAETPQKNQGRQEESYFFPDERITIKAFSMEEALKKLKEFKK